jgi:hypothetical protein
LQGVVQNQISAQTVAVKEDWQVAATTGSFLDQQTDIIQQHTVVLNVPFLPTGPTMPTLIKGHNETADSTKRFGHFCVPPRVLAQSMHDGDRTRRVASRLPRLGKQPSSVAGGQFGLAVSH